MYCKYCGHRKVEVESKFYDEETGEKLLIFSCVNEACPSKDEELGRN